MLRGVEGLRWDLDSHLNGSRTSRTRIRATLWQRTRRKIFREKKLIVVNTGGAGVAARLNQDGLVLRGYTGLIFAVDSAQDCWVLRLTER